MKKVLVLLLLLLASSSQLHAQLQKKFEYLDVFQLEYTGDPQISPDGNYVVYRRTGFDIMKDRSKGNLWLLSTDERKIHHKLTNFDGNERQARWSPSGDRIAYVRNTDNGSEIFVYWTDSGASAKLTQLENSPSSISWSPDGTKIAFTMKVNAKAPVIAKMPAKPKDAKWAKAPRITDRLKHESDGSGYIKPGFTHIFTIPAEGGSSRQLTSKDRNHSGNLSWSPDGLKIFFSSNLNEDWEYDFRNTEIYAINTETLQYETLTERPGPDSSPKVSPDGQYIASIGFEDKVQTYQTRKIELMDSRGGNKQILSKNLDRSAQNIQWANDSKGLYFMYKDKGLTKLAYINLNGKVTDIADNVGGTTLGRPYSSGSFSVSKNGKIAYTISSSDRPADVAIISKGQKNQKKLTGVNDDLLDYRMLGSVAEIWYKSSFDGRDLHGYLVYPSDYDVQKKYPLLVENHGGPILNYGPHFSAEMQLYAAAGYVVFYPNPRGSTSYGEEFGNLLFNNYPGQDYNDVMDGVDELVKQGKVDEEQLYVTGGSAGGIMTAWIVGKTDRFRAAVVAKPVINWISKTLVADNYYGYANSRYPGQPWENFEGYWKFSPLSLVGNIETPTMVMVGMNDLRTPPSEAKQLYHALKLRKIETVLVEIPEASHGIAARPSNLITKIAHTLAWFEKYKE
ncbi:MAG: S9 family peptidase [Bacteroidia bacterium]|nr:S9 family peptidase [Bacteroidia bacterium]NNF31973.1 S9 family peptidase [Flavobacteriaceae bacterium]MBT8276189.1 S9 family peptidase [Bacteroidia bacterium]NNJ83063.1 S9 family peptidase [Flavobacteriaceae bacterium]NNK52964.1 S9 family peptidase [Flavobacteriaceae bacterium]